VLSRATSVEADQRLHRFCPFARTRFEAEQQNSQTKRDYHRNYHCTASYSCVHCTAMARGWDFIIPPLRQKVESLQLSSLRSSASISHTIMGSPRYSGVKKELAVCLRTFGYAEPASSGSVAARPRARGSCKGKPLSLRPSCLLFGGRVFEKPLLFLPDAQHCECRQNSQRDFGEAMRRSNPWRLCARNHHDASPA